MKSLLLLTIAVLGLAGRTCGESAPPAEKDAKPVEAVVGKEFTITLDANHSTGYSWQLAKPLTETLVKSTTHSYQEAATEAGAPPRAGAGGKEVWTFKAISPGSTVIEFKYVRPWEKDTPPVKTAKFPLVIKPPAP
ncbi:MAG: protease inhibitor I42 family protein [Verrucomicrobiota bacterium]